jgi:purine-binding chemotaxis protein CheW
MSVEVELQAQIDVLRGQLSQLEDRLGHALRRREPLAAEFDALLVRINRTHAALELEAVREVVPAAELSPVPEAPAWVLGMLNLRGSTLPVVDIGMRLEARGPRLLLSDLIVVASTRAGTAGLVVSEVGIITRVSRETLEASLLETPHAPYVLGTFAHNSRSTVLLGVNELMRHSELSPLVRPEPVP